jgi:hypothetical protein
MCRHRSIRFRLVIAATRRGAGDGWGSLTGGFWSFSFVSMVTLERQHGVPTPEHGNDQIFSP